MKRYKIITETMMDGTQEFYVKYRYDYWPFWFYTTDFWNDSKIRYYKYYQAENAVKELLSVLERNTCVNKAEKHITIASINFEKKLK